MKKLIAMTLALVMLFSLCACGKKDAEAKALCVQAYEELNKAYDLLEPLTYDYGTAWEKAVYQNNKVISGGATYLAKDMYLTEAEMKSGLAYHIATYVSKNNWSYEDWNSLYFTAEDMFLETASYVMSAFRNNGNLFVPCVFAVRDAYFINGKAQEADAALQTAAELLASVKELNPEYEYYHELMAYYDLICKYYNVCTDPINYAGSYTLVSYQNEITDFYSDVQDIRTNMDAALLG